MYLVINRKISKPMNDLVMNQVNQKPKKARGPYKKRKNKNKRKRRRRKTGNEVTLKETLNKFGVKDDPES